MTIHWKAHEEHFLISLAFRFNHYRKKFIFWIFLTPLPELFVDNRTKHYWPIPPLPTGQKKN
jgi:hypothetical protein